MLLLALPSCLYLPRKKVFQLKVKKLKIFQSKKFQGGGGERDCLINSRESDAGKRGVGNNSRSSSRL